MHIVRKTIIYLVLVLSGCINTADPLSTAAGRKDAIDAYVGLAAGYLREGETESAKVPLNKALAIDSNNPNAHMVLAQVFFRENEFAIADMHFNKAISSAPQDSTILNNYAAFLEATNNNKKALYFYEKASQNVMYEQRSMVLENLGLMQKKMGLTRDAEISFNKSLKINQIQPRSLIEMAYISYDKGDMQSAWGYYQAYRKNVRPTPRSLFLGISVARALQLKDEIASLELQMRNMFPTSDEYKKLTESS